jgi:hypothetical protein
MAALGKCLVFHLKYGLEMKQLYWTKKKPDLEGLEDSERVFDMIRAVGDTACREAADFLEASAEKIEEHFRGFCDVRTETKRHILEKQWQVVSNISLERKPGREFSVGVFIKEARRAAVPWVWRVGGRRAEDSLIKILGRRVHSRSGEELITESGAVALACIPMVLDNHQGFDVDRNPLIDQVQKTFANMTVSDVEAILSI